MAPAVSGGIGMAWLVSARWAVQLGVAYRRLLSGEPDDESVYTSTDPQAVWVTAGVGRD
jgi:hypothetical protein